MPAARSPRSRHSELKYWFPAKRYGWGWGLPLTWQGWIAVFVLIALAVTGSALFPPKREPISFAVYIGVLVFLFFGICWLKGEPPHWRWGKSVKRDA